MSEDIFINQIKSGDKEAFKRVIDMYQKKVLKIAYGYTNDFHDSDDIAQDVFITLYHNLNKLVSLEHLKFLIYRITVSRSLDFLRKNRFRKLFTRYLKDDEDKIKDIPDRRDDAETGLIRSESGAAFLNALSRLSEKQKTVFMLKNHEGLKIREIAKVSNMSESTVKTHLFRAIRALRKEIVRFK